MIKEDGLRDPFTGKPAVNFLDKDSFIQKMHLHAQEFQKAVIIVKEFYIKHVKNHNGDVEYWVKEIFQSCLKHKDLVKFFNSIFSLLPNGNDPKLAKDLLNNPDTMRDQASQLANAIKHKICYSKLLEQGLLTIKQTLRKDKMPSHTNFLLFARAHAHDWDNIREENLLQMVLWKMVHFALFLVKISINFSPSYSTVFFPSQCTSLLYNNFKILVQKFQNFCTMF
jgi:hypothetical protein